MYNNDGAWCTHEQIKRSIFGIGPRYCIEYSDNPKMCPFKKKHKKGPAPKPPKPLKS